MKSGVCLLGVLLIIGINQTFAQGLDPMADLFPPDLLMQHQKKIGLSEEQAKFVKQEIQKTQTRFTELQWQLQGEMEALSELIKQERVAEQPVLAQLDKVLDIEREIKKTQIGMLVRLKNKLTSSQIAQLRELKGQKKLE